MTIKELEQYRYMQKEVKLLTARLEKLYAKPSVMVSDSVRASSSQLPYQEHITVVTGLGGEHKKTEAKLVRKLKIRKKAMAEKILMIEDFIYGIADSEIRQIVDCRYVQGLSWQDTSNTVYGYASEARARMAVTRFLRKS